MMSLLSVTVKKANFVGAQAQQFNSYVTLKLQNVKSTTVTVKGATPCWEQDFLFETNDLNTGLLIEVWNKGMLWDRAMGYHYVPLQTVKYSNEEGNGQWMPLEADLVMRDGEVVGTENQTGNSILVDCRFEIPFGPYDPPTGWREILQQATDASASTANSATVCNEFNSETKDLDPENIEASELQRKLEMLNNIMDQEQRAEQARRQMQFIGHSGYSEDSDYTSDLNYPVGGQHANYSASQFRSAAHQMNTNERSLETSRENSYERDEQLQQHSYHLPQPPVTYQQHLSPGSMSKKHHHQRYSPNADDYSSYGSGTSPRNNYQTAEMNNVDSEPLFYNSRPRAQRVYSSQENWASCDSNFYEPSTDVGVVEKSNFYKGVRRPSLERQTTLYDDPIYCENDNIYHNPQISQVNYALVNSKMYNFEGYDDEFYDASSEPFQYNQKSMYGQDEEDRQWDSGGNYEYVPPPSSIRSKKLPTIPNSRAGKLSTLNNDSFYSVYDDRKSYTPTQRRKMPQIPTKNSSNSIDEYANNRTNSRRGASLPPTPTKTSKLFNNRNKNNLYSLPATPGRQLPTIQTHRSAKMKQIKRTNSAEQTELNNFYHKQNQRAGAISANEYYLNEDYNYAYQSIEDNLPNINNFEQQHQFENVSGFNNADFSGETQTQFNSNTLYNYNAQNSLDASHKNSFDERLFDGYQIDHEKPQLQTQPQPQPHAPTQTQTQNQTQMQYYRDQTYQNQAISSSSATMENGTIQTATTTIAQVHSNKNTDVLPRFFKQQETIMDDEDFYEPELSSAALHQESVETYIEDDDENLYSTSTISAINTSNADNSTSEPAPPVIFEDKLIIDPYHPSVQRPPEEEYVPIPSRRGSMIVPESNAVRRLSSELYQNSVDELFASTPSTRKQSVDSYQTVIARRSSVRQSATTASSSPTVVLNSTENDNNLLPSIEVTAPILTGAAIENETDQSLDTGQQLDGEKKSVSFEEDDEKAKRPQVTAQQRWLWAYNKIIMQLNVSTL